MIFLFVAVLFKRRDFLSLSHCYAIRIKDMSQRTQQGWSLNILKFTEKHARAWINICKGILCFSSIHLWYKLRVWKLLKLRVLSFPTQIAKAFSKSAWTCYFYEWGLPKLQKYHATFSNFYLVILSRLPIKSNNQIDLTKSSLAHVLYWFCLDQGDNFLIFSRLLRFNC